MNAVRLVLILAASLSGTAAAQPADPIALDALAGDWFLTLDPGETSHTGVLQFESSAGSVVAFVDGGPVDLATDGSRLTLDIDTRDGGGRLLSYHLEGTLAGDALGGTLQPPLDAAAGTWRAERITAHTRRPPRPVDFSGIWSRTSSGIAKVHLDYTAAAQERVDNYHYLDDPALRCVSPGVVRVSGWPYPLEILQNDTQLTILYESFHEVRRIYLDGREFPTDLPPSFMGYSVGHWDGPTLVVETKQLKPGFVDLHGQPLSEEARVVERMSLTEDGNVMRSEMTVYDPQNYRRPITRHRQWRKTPETVILEYDCDPYPFFRGLELEGTLELYWDRMRQRR
jgi:hypothetical protein